MINSVKIRDCFPLLHQKISGKNLIYFDNSATTQKPQVVIDMINNYYSAYNSNVHRGAHYLSQLATNKFEETRKTIKNFINAKHAKEIIFTKGTTDSINLVANGYQSILKKGDEVIISQMEHHSNIVPWQMCCDKTGAILRAIPVLENGDLDLSSFKKMLNKKTKLVSLTHVSNVLGTINPIKRIASLAHKIGAVVFIDGAQAISHSKVDVQKLGVDFYSFSGHKMYGPTGTGVLYGKKDLLMSLPPYQLGGEMIKDVSFKKTTYADLPYKFEAGTPNISGVICLKKAIDFITELGIKNIEQYEAGLLDYALQELSKIDGIIFIGNSNKRAAVISFNIEGIHPYDLGVILDKMGIAVRTGHHCAQPIMCRFNISGTIRISFAVYNTNSEIDDFILALKKAILMLL